MSREWQFHGVYVTCVLFSLAWGVDCGAAEGPAGLSQHESSRGRHVVQVAQQPTEVLPPATVRQGAPEVSMSELTIDTSIARRVRETDELDPPTEVSPYVLAFDTPWMNPDLRFSYAQPALGFRHQPLYFEDVLLERYGVLCGPVLDPVISSMHFFGTIAILPYKMTVNHPHHTMATYGPRSDFWRTSSPDYSRWPSDPQWRSALGVYVETLVVSALVFGL